jgi:hypothetical protein
MSSMLFQTAAKASELLNIRFLDLRDTSATLLLAADIHPQMV